MGAAGRPQTAGGRLSPDASSTHTGSLGPKHPWLRGQRPRAGLGVAQAEAEARAALGRALLPRKSAGRDGGLQGGGSGGFQEGVSHHA